MLIGALLLFVFFFFLAPKVRDKIAVPCHGISYLYQKCMGAVDQLDHISDRGISRRPGHWPHRVANWLCDCNSANDCRIATHSQGRRGPPRRLQEVHPGQAEELPHGVPDDEGLGQGQTGDLERLPMKRVS